MAALTIAASVPLAVFLVFQRSFIRGLMSGAVKA
jgi:ABC-type glycerol-3-phosphate transport system permease component